jgi:hypothetical protein
LNRQIVRPRSTDDEDEARAERVEAGALTCDR